MARYLAIIDEDEGRLGAYFPDAPGCVAMAETEVQCIEIERLAGTKPNGQQGGEQDACGGFHMSIIAEAVSASRQSRRWWQAEVQADRFFGAPVVTGRSSSLRTSMLPYLVSAASRAQA